MVFILSFVYVVYNMLINLQILKSLCIPGILLLPGSVVRDCTFQRICPFLLGCPFCWHYIVRICQVTFNRMIPACCFLFLINPLFPISSWQQEWVEQHAVLRTEILGKGICLDSFQHFPSMTLFCISDLVCIRLSILWLLIKFHPV